MTEYKTEEEMEAAEEFIQQHELLRSGSLTDGIGVNRSLQRLARSLDGLYSGTRTVLPVGGGTISFASEILGWSSTITLRFPEELGGVKSNVISSGTVTGLSAGVILYVKLNRSSDGATVTFQKAASMTAYLAILAGDADRLDYLLFASAESTGLAFFNGQRLKPSESFTNGWSTDSQYAQQTEMDLVHAMEIEDRNLIMTRGGLLSWDSGTALLSWSDDLILDFPAESGSNRILAGSITIPPGHALYAVLVREPTGVNNVTAVTAAMGSVPKLDTTYVIALHKSADGRLYLRTGQSLGDGDQVLLGGLRTGVQWAYTSAGAGAQVVDFTESGAYPSRTYTVGAKELFLFRNGVKARGSLAYWAGAYPTGSLIGTILAGDEYVEEDGGDGSGNRVIWLQDDQAASEPLYHPAATHDPVWTWPASDDYIEACIGVQGNGPSPVESVGIEGESATLEGAVKFKAGTNVALTYDGNAIVISQTNPAVTVTVNGGPAISGVIDFANSSDGLLEVEAAGNTVRVKVTANKAAALSQALDPSTTNAFLTQNAVDHVSGFESIWLSSSTVLKTAGGCLHVAGRDYRSVAATGNNGYVSLNVTTDLLGGDAGGGGETWTYVYLYAAATPGHKPRIVYSTSPPAAGGNGVGVHPSNAALKFLTSLYVNSPGGAASIRGGFSRAGGWCHYQQLDTAMTTLLAAGTSGYQLHTLVPGVDIPETGVKIVRIGLVLNVDTAAILAGQEAYIDVRDVATSKARRLYAIRPGNATTVRFEFETPLNESNQFSLSLAGAQYDTPPVASAKVLGFYEGRWTTSTGLGS